MTISTLAAPLGDAVGVEEVPDPQVPERARRRSFTAKYKAEILAEYDRLDRDGRGALLRREGLYSSHIAEWRKQAEKGALEALGRTRAARRPIRWTGDCSAAGRERPGCGPKSTPRGG